MSDQNSNHAGKMVYLSLDRLSFDSFDRSSTDIICVAPVRTIVRREEKIVLIRKVRKVEEIDASPACPVNAGQVTPVQEGESVVFVNESEPQQVG